MHGADTHEWIMAAMQLSPRPGTSLGARSFMHLCTEQCHSAALAKVCDAVLQDATHCIYTLLSAVMPMCKSDSFVEST